MTPNPDNGKEQREFREFWIGDKPVIESTDEEKSCWPAFKHDCSKLSDRNRPAKLIHVVEIAKVRELEERLEFHIEENQKFIGKNCELAEKITQLEAEKETMLNNLNVMNKEWTKFRDENEVLREGLLEIQARVPSAETIIAKRTLERADAIREGE